MPRLAERRVEGGPQGSDFLGRGLLLLCCFTGVATCFQYEMELLSSGEDTPLPLLTTTFRMNFHYNVNQQLRGASPGGPE